MSALPEGAPLPDETTEFDAETTETGAETLPGGPRLLEDREKTPENLAEEMRQLRERLLDKEHEAKSAKSRLGKLLGTRPSRDRTWEVRILEHQYQQIQKELLKSQLESKKQTLESRGADSETIVLELSELAAHGVISEKEQYLHGQEEREGTGWVREHVIKPYKNLGLKKKLLISGALIGGAAAAGAFGQAWLAGGLLAARSALGTLGTSIATEAVIERAHTGELKKKGLTQENIFAEFGDELRIAAVEAIREQSDPNEAVQAVLEMAMRKKKIDLEGKFQERTRLQSRQGIRKTALVGLMGSLAATGCTGRAFGMLAEKAGLGDAWDWGKEKLGFGTEVQVTEGKVISAGMQAEASLDQPISAEAPDPGASIKPEAGALPAEAPDPNASIPAKAEVLDGQELSPEAAEGVLSKLEIGKGDTLWGSIRQLYIGNAAQAGFEGDPNELKGWASQQTGKALRELAKSQGGNLQDLIHVGDSVSLTSSGIVFENTSGIKPGVLVEGSGVDADEILRQSVAATRQGMEADRILSASVEATRSGDYLGFDVTQPPAAGETGAYIDPDGTYRVVAIDQDGNEMNLSTEGHLADASVSEDLKGVPVYTGEASDGNQVVFGQNPETGIFEAAPTEQPTRVTSVDIFDTSGDENPAVRFEYPEEDLTAEAIGVADESPAVKFEYPEEDLTTEAIEAEEETPGEQPETTPDEEPSQGMERWRGGAKFSYDDNGKIIGVAVERGHVPDSQWRSLINRENLPKNMLQQQGIELQAKQLAVYQDLYNSLQAKGMDNEASFVKSSMSKLISMTERFHGDVFKPAA